MDITFDGAPVQNGQQLPLAGLNSSINIAWIGDANEDGAYTGDLGILVAAYGKL